MDETPFIPWSIDGIRPPLPDSPAAQRWKADNRPTADPAEQGNPAWPANSTIGVVATDAALTKAQMKRIAIMTQDGFALSLRPAHAPMDGDIVFAATTGRAARIPDLADVTEIGMLAAECMARAIVRGVYEATSLANGVAPPSWREVHGRQ